MDVQDLSQHALSVDHESLVNWLCQPQNYPDHPEKVGLIETHISQVFLTDRYVYKLKKPVKYDFLDFSTVSKREQACRDELRLNRRMTHDVYLDVWPITFESTGKLKLGGTGQPVDWVVRMRRLPNERMLDVLIRDHRLMDDEVRIISEYLGSHYASIERLHSRPKDFHAALVMHVRGNLQALLNATNAPKAQVQRVHTPQLRLLKCQANLFQARAIDGRVIDGHGDLRPEHICVIDPPAVFDCIEFSEDLRRVDVLDELCFLAMECDLLMADQIGNSVLEAYQAKSHDRPPLGLILFYKTYRASVRAKVAALRAEQLQHEAREKQSQLAKQYLDLADGYLREAGARPLLVCVAGLMGSGKTTLARALAAELGADLLRTDVLRNELFPPQGKHEAFGTGRYQAESRALVYQEMMRQAHERLNAGISVILDATFAQAETREAALQCAREATADFYFVECFCPREIALQRIEARQQQVVADASEARPEFYERQALEWQPIAKELPHGRVNTTLSLGEQLEKLFKELPMPFLENPLLP